MVRASPGLLLSKQGNLIIRKVDFDQLGDRHSLYDQPTQFDCTRDGGLVRFLDKKAFVDSDARRSFFNRNYRLYEIEAVERDLFGFVVLKQVITDHSQLQMGFRFEDSHDVNSECVIEALSFIFSQIFSFGKAYRIFTQVKIDNRLLLNTLEFLGMVREAHLRENYCYEGRWSDEYVYTILAEDFRQNVDLHQRGQTP